MTDILDEIVRIRSILDPYDSSPTECDGMTNLCHTVLCRKDILHQVMRGRCFLEFIGFIEPHYWIDLKGDLKEYTIDYRCRMWLGDFPGIPHGVFIANDFPIITYEGEPINLHPLPEVIFQALLLPIPEAMWMKIKKE